MSSPRYVINSTDGKKSGAVSGVPSLPNRSKTGNNQRMEQPPPVSVEAVRTWDRPLVMIPLFILIAAVGGLFASFTLSANLLVLAVGGTLLWIGLTGRAGRRPASARLGRGAAWWLVPLLFLSFIELFAFSKKSIDDYPTLSLIADPILEGYLPRTALYFAWLTAFWGLVRR